MHILTSFRSLHFAALLLLSFTTALAEPVSIAEAIETMPQNNEKNHTQLLSSETFPTTHEATLQNGLKVIIREDHRAPVVTTMVWYKVGSVDEPRGLGGISHMLEHMMFKGTDKLGPNEHSTIIANLGGRDNAFTSYDYTAYFENLPAWELETALKLEADRMQNLVLKEEEFVPEREVVAEERRQRTDSNPQAQLYEIFNATLWTTSAYRNPIIGWMPEIQSWTLDDLKKWYALYYAPNNATLVIAGDVDPNTTLTLVEKYFGAIPRGEKITYPNEFEVPQKGEKRVDLALKANMPLLYMAYKVPSINSAQKRDEVYALLLASLILDGSSSARLSKNLVRDAQIALQASNYYNFDMRFDTTFMFAAVPADKSSLEELELALKDEVARLRETLVTTEEIERVLNLYRAAKVYEKDSVYAQAMQIGAAETTGEGWQHREQLLEHLATVTPEMIQHVAQKYLNDDALTVGTLHPLEAETHTDQGAHDAQ